MCFHFEQEHFFHAFYLITVFDQLLLVPWYSSKIPIYRRKGKKNIFAYLQLTNFVVWTLGNDQLRRIITLEHFMIWKYPWNVIG